MATQSLTNIDNYKQHSTETSAVAFSRFLNIAGDYLVQCCDNIHIRNVSYYKYVVSQGMSTIGHVFLTLYLYTNNIELTAFHCHKAVYYYIEFIGQIGDDHHSFLQLNSRDAMLFVYKKTIFEIDNSYRKEFASPRIPGSPQSNLDVMVKTFVRHNAYSLERTNLSPDEKSAVLLEHKVRIDKLSIALINLSVRGEDEFGKKLDLLFVVEDGLSRYDVCKTEYVEVFCKRLRKKSTNESQLRERFKAVNARVADGMGSTYTATKLAQLLLPS